MGGPSKQVGDKKFRPPLPHQMFDLLPIYFRSKRMPTAFGAPDGEQAHVQPPVGDRQSRLVNIYFVCCSATSKIVRDAS